MGSVRAANGMQQPLGQELLLTHAAEPLHQSRQYLGTAGIIVEHSPRLMGRCCREEGFRPVFIDAFSIGGAPIAGSHAEHIPDFQAHEPLIRVFRQPIREKLHNGIIQRQLAVVHQHTNGNACHGLGDGIHLMLLPFLKRSIVSFCLHDTMHRQLKAVHIHLFTMKPVNEALYRSFEPFCHVPSSPRWI